MWEKNRSKSLLLSTGLRLCSLMRMLSHVSELPCLTLPIRLVCPLADRKPTKQNSCRWQYKISLQRRLLTITSDLPGASHQAKDIVVAPGEPFCTANGSYFVLWLSVCQGQTRRVGRFSQASLLAWMNITAWLQGRKPRESNKLFDLFPLQANPLNPSYPW